MTLDTRIFVSSPFDYEDFFFWANKNLLNTDSPRFTKTVPGEVIRSNWTDDRVADSHEFSNHPGQGLDAWFMLHGYDEPQSYATWYVPERKYYDDEESYQESLEEQAKRTEIVGDYYAYMSFDTAYAFKTVEGLGCADLHASYIVRMYREYFEPRGIDIVWENEFTGQLWKNLDTEGLSGLIGQGIEAQKWFNNVALPAILDSLQEKNQGE